MNKVKIITDTGVTVLILNTCSARARSHEQHWLTDNQALCDIDYCTKRVTCNTRVATAFCCVVLFSTGNLSSSFFTVPFDVGFRVPIHWACKRFHNSFSHKSIFSSTGSLDRIFKEKESGIIKGNLIGWVGFGTQYSWGVHWRAGPMQW